MIMKLSKKLFQKLQQKDYRSEYVAEHVRTGVAMQIRAMREQRGMSQEALAERMGTSQSAVARAENPDYGKHNIQTLLDVASALDVALHIQFLSFPHFIYRMSDVSPKALQVTSYDEKAFSPSFPIVPQNPVYVRASAPKYVLRMGTCEGRGEPRTKIEQGSVSTYHLPVKEATVDNHV